MFCRYCGKELTATSERCTNCGASPLSGTNFCPGCGAPTTSATEVCAQCGAQVARSTGRWTWRATAAGILAIVAGAIGIVELVTIIVIVACGLGWTGIIDLFRDLGGIITAILAIVIPIRIVALVGGISALRRQSWGLALAGCVCALFSSVLILLTVPLGIAAIVLVVLGKGEFE